MGSMGFMANQLKEQQKMVERGTIQSLKNEIGMLLDSEKHCRTSLAGDGGLGSPSTPIQFKKSNIDDQKSTEGLEVELYTSSQDGKSRSAKMFSATDSKFRFYGSLEILSIKLFMDKKEDKEDKEGTDDYLESEGHEDIGTLKVTVKGLEKETSFDIRLSVWMKTDADNNTTLLSCSKSSSSVPKCGTGQKFHPVCGCVFEDKEGYTGSKCVSCFSNQVWDKENRACVCPEGMTIVGGGGSGVDDRFKMCVHMATGPPPPQPRSGEHACRLRNMNPMHKNCYEWTAEFGCKLRDRCKP